MGDGPDDLVLVEFRGGKATVAARAKRYDSLYALASIGAATAVVTVEAKAGAWRLVTLGMYGLDGHTRWSARIPMPKSVVGWVAGSASNVAVAFGDKLHAWSADGKSLW